VQTDGGARPLYEVVAERAKSWDRHGNVGLVVGATYPEEMKRLRALCPGTYAAPCSPGFDRIARSCCC